MYVLPEATVHQLTWPPPPEHCVGCVSVIDDAALVGVIDDAQWTSVRSLLSARAALSCAWKRLFRRSSEREADRNSAVNPPRTADRMAITMTSSIIEEVVKPRPEEKESDQ